MEQSSQELEMSVLLVSVINGTSTMLTKTGRSVSWPMLRRTSRPTARPCIMTLSTPSAGSKNGVARDPSAWEPSYLLTSSISSSHCQTVPFTSPTTPSLTICRATSKEQFQVCSASSLKTFLTTSGAISCLARNTRAEKCQRINSIS